MYRNREGQPSLLDAIFAFASTSQTTARILSFFASKTAMFRVKVKSASGEKWRLRTEQQRLEIVNEVVADLAGKFHIPPPHIEIGRYSFDNNGEVRMNHFKPDPNFHGWYGSKDHILVINHPELGNLKSLVQTLAHEMRHAYQSSQVKALASGTNTQPEAATWKINFDNPINPVLDHQGYYRMAIEQDARAFALEYLNWFSL